MKTIKINNKDVKLSFSPYSLLIYKQQFGVEPLDVVIQPLYNICNIVDEIITTGDVSGEILLSIATKLSEAGHINLYGILWAFIKTADESTPDFYEWMRGLDSLPIIDVLYEIAPDFMESMITKKKVNQLGVQVLLKSLALK